MLSYSPSTSAGALRHAPVTKRNRREGDAHDLLVIFACKAEKTVRPIPVMVDSSPSMVPAADDASDDLPALPIWTLVLGVLALLTFGLTSVPAIICGHRALMETGGSTQRSLGRSVAVAGLVVGYVGVAVLGAWILFLLRLSLPH